jgi:fibronectin-binding autotransporter adhesin
VRREHINPSGGAPENGLLLKFTSRRGGQMARSTLRSGCRALNRQSILTLAIATLSLGVFATESAADVFTYNKNSSGTTQWSNPAINWSSAPNPPTSASNTTLNFIGGSTGALANAVNVISNNDLAGNFLLNQMNLQYSGPTSGTAPTVTISGNPLEFVNDNLIAPMISFNTIVGARTPVVTISANVIATNTLTLNSATAAATNNISGVVSGGSIVSTGIGVVALTNAANAYTGVTTLNSGTLRVGTIAGVDTASSLGTGTLGGSAGDIVFGGGALQYSGAAASTNRLFTIGNANGNTATLDASGNSTGGFNWTNTGAITLVNAAPHSLNFGGSQANGSGFSGFSTFAPKISDYDLAHVHPTSVTKNGASAWTLSAANDYTGGTTINAGVIRSTTAGGLGSGDIHVTSTAGQAFLTGVGVYSNNFFITGSGPLTAQSTISSNYGAILLGPGAEISGTITLQGNAQMGVTFDSNTNAIISGNITETLDGHFNLQYGNPANARGGSLLISSPNNSYTGSTNFVAGNVSVGTLSVSLGHNEVIPDGAGIGSVTMTASTLSTLTIDLKGFDETVNGLTSAGNGGDTRRVITGTAASNLIVGNGDSSGSYLGRINGAMSLTKIGTGTQTLRGTSSYAGATIITGGTLEIHNDTTLTPSNPGRLGGATAISIAATAQLLLSGQTANSDRLNDASAIDLAGGAFSLNGLSEGSASANGVGVLTVSANSVIDFGAGNTSIVRFAGINHPGNAVLTINNWDGIVDVGGGTERLLFAGNPSDFTNVFDQDEVFFGATSGYAAITVAGDPAGVYEIVPTSAAPIPEPASLAVLGLGVMGLAFRRRR